MPIEREVSKIDIKDRCTWGEFGGKIDVVLGIGWPRARFDMLREMFDDIERTDSFSIQHIPGCLNDTLRIDCGVNRKHLKKWNLDFLSKQN
jgi:hypothetical protein